MELTAPVKPDYAAIVVRVESLHKLEGADFLQGIPMFGLQAIVGLDVKVGDLGLFFPAEAQLSFDYCYENNLHSHATKAQADGSMLALNRDPDAKGYFGDNRRVRAITLRKARSDALFMSLSSLEWTGINVADLNEGDTFDTLNGHAICNKYVIPTKVGNVLNQAQVTRAAIVEARVFPEHFDSPQYFRVDRNLDPNAYAVVTQKLHGSSVRFGYVPTTRHLSWLELFLKKCGVKIQETKYSFVVGSRKVVKSVDGQ